MNQDLQTEVEERKRAEFDERQAREMAEKLRTAGEEINKSLDFEALLETILVQLERIIPYDGANIFIIEGDKAVMRKHIGYERFGKHVPALMDHFVMNLEDIQMYQAILKTHHPVVVSDTLADPRWLRMDVDMKQIRSWCGLPLMVQDQVYGVLGLDKLQSGFYTEKDIEFLQIYAGQAALAMENARLFSELSQMARLDALTGVYNRRAFFERAQEELQRSCRYGSEVSVIMLDIDRFKRTNDTYGHPVGDQVLQAVARRCRESLREVDLFGRYGGEEFVALLPQTGREQAAVTAGRLRHEIANTDILTDAGPVHTTISLGVTAFNRNCEILEELLERADQALYRSKRNGRDRVSVV
jgi:diguanylate cyclase (GGDEF)-like protein